MAIYVYHCDHCDVDIEREHRMGQQPDYVECGGCGTRARRKFLAPPVHYKGFGWTWAGNTHHGEPDLDDREDMPGPLEFGDLMEE